jgi:hypothetical protein
MFHSILDALMAVLWLGSTVGCALLAVLMRPRSDTDGENRTGQSGALGGVSTRAIHPTGEKEGGTE